MEYYTLPAWDKTKYRVNQKSKYMGGTITQIIMEDAAPIHEHSESITFDIINMKKGNPTIIVHPILGGKNLVAQTFAWLFAKICKWNSVIVHRANHPDAIPSALEDGLKNIVMNNLQVLEFLESEEGKKFVDFNRDKAACLGTSLGAITTALLTKFLPVKAFVMVMGGGDIPDLTMRSVELKESMEMSVKKYNINKQDLHLALRETIKTDPLFLADQGEKCLMLNTLFDRSVMTDNQKRLVSAFENKPRVWWFPAGHYTMFLFFPILFVMSWWHIRRQIKN